MHSRVSLLYALKDATDDMDCLGGELVEDRGLGQAVSDLMYKWRNVANDTLRSSQASDSTTGEDVLAAAGLYARLEAVVNEYVAAMHYCACELAEKSPALGTLIYACALAVLSYLKQKSLLRFDRT